MATTDAALRIGWGAAEITPPEPVCLCGQFHARVSEGVEDPLTVTALALERAGREAVFVSCDLVFISAELRAAVAERLAALPAGPAPANVILHATHIHTGPQLRPPPPAEAAAPAGLAALGLAVMPVTAYLSFAAERIAAAVEAAWRDRRPGRAAWGLEHAVVGRNRRWIDAAGRATMYGETAVPDFRHIEGYEDHDVHLLATYDEAGGLTGVVVNVACPAQVSEHSFRLSADYWCETRRALRARHGAGLQVLPQCSAAGDQSPHPLFERSALRRMDRLRGQSEREAIGARLARAVDAALPAIAPAARADLPLAHEVRTLDLPMRALSEADVQTAVAEAEALETERDAELRRLAAAPGGREDPHWYVPVTRAHRRAQWFREVARRYAEQQRQATWPATLHAVRLGEVAFVTNPFEYYVDYGIAIKARSPFLQTFVVQLAGPGGYAPSARSVAAGGYGSIPASNPIGPAAGAMVAEETLALLERLSAAGGAGAEEG
jgi:hypothetical protein